MPYPIECTTNKRFPEDSYFADGEKFIIKEKPLCVDCKRYPEYSSWKQGDWDEIIWKIECTEDLREMDPPNQNI